jgi:hypothetical protein
MRCYRATVQNMMGGRRQESTPTCHKVPKSKRMLSSQAQSQTKLGGRGAGRRGSWRQSQHQDPLCEVMVLCVTSHI